MSVGDNRFCDRVEHGDEYGDEDEVGDWIKYKVKDWIRYRDERLNYVWSWI